MGQRTRQSISHPVRIGRLALAHQKSLRTRLPKPRSVAGKTFSRCGQVDIASNKQDFQIRLIHVCRVTCGFNCAACLWSATGVTVIRDGARLSSGRSCESISREKTSRRKLAFRRYVVLHAMNVHARCASTSTPKLVAKQSRLRLYSVFFMHPALAGHNCAN